MASPKPIDLLRDAIAAARSALRDLDDEEVPARVRRVRASSERTLPPPLAMSLLKELAGSEFLREKALGAWDGEPPESGPALAGWVFLERGPDWEATLMAEALAMGERRGAATDRSGELERESLAAEVASLKDQLDRLKGEASERERELRAALGAARAPGRSARQAEEKARARLEEERKVRSAREAELEARAQGLDAEIKRLKEAVRDERVARADLATRLESESVRGLPSDPAGLARLLDDLAAHSMALSPVAVGPAGDDPDEPESVPFDASVRPDRAEAVDWLIQAGSVTVLVDGYNLGFAFAEDDPMRARVLALEVVGRLATIAGDAEFTVVFDSARDDAYEPVPGEARSTNVAIEFPAGMNADDAIVATVAARSTPTVVITDDRELRHRSEAEGAVALWSGALVEWSRRR